jgi:uncharacterized protein with HEPN domain
VSIGVAIVSSSVDPDDCIEHILENIRRIESYIGEFDYERFAGDQRTIDAVERCLERLCEAASRLGDAAPRLMPNQPWRDIRGMGNRLRHDFDRVNRRIIWDTVEVRLPGLKADAEAARVQLYLGLVGGLKN